MGALYRLLGGWCATLRSLLVAERGAIAIMFAIAVIPLVIAVGVGIDLWRAFAVRTRMQAALDSAALAVASTDPATFTTQQMQARAQAFFNASYPASGMLGTPGTVTLSYSGTNNSVITVSGSATVPTTFMQLADIQQLTVAASAQVTLASPNIDFYMLLDDSPSMGIGATTTDITTMVNNTQYECDSYGSSPSGNKNCGCGFACHESNPSGDTCALSGTGSAEATGSCGSLGPVCPSQQTCTGSGRHRTCGPPYTVTTTVGCNPNISATTGAFNGTTDNYALAQSLGVTLRIDNLRIATQDLMSTASTTEQSNAAIYRVAINTFDVNFNTIQTLTSNLTTAQTAAASIAELPVYDNNCLTSSNCNNDADTNYDNAMNSINMLMPKPGNGTNFAGDKPQEVLYWVTDGVEDEDVSSLSPAESCPYPNPDLASVDCDGTRQQSVMDTGWCNTIKNRGITIAVLYLDYFPLPTNGWYNTYVSPFQSNISSILQSCASPTPFTPSGQLFFSVQTGGDVTAAMAALFEDAVNTAYLSR